MSGLTLLELDLTEAEVKKLLDQPAQKFLKTETIVSLNKRAFNIIDYQIDINEENRKIVVDCIYAITAWQAFGAYGNSISQTLQLQDIEAYKTNLDHYRDIAYNYAALIGIDLNRKKQDAKAPLSDSIPLVLYGGSLIDVDRDI